MVSTLSKALSRHRYLLIAIALVGIVALNTCVRGDGESEVEPERGTIILEGAIASELKLFATWAYYTDVDSWWCTRGVALPTMQRTGEWQEVSPVVMERLPGDRYRLVMQIAPPSKRFLAGCDWYVSGPRIYVGLADGADTALLIKREEVGQLPPFSIECTLLTVRPRGQEPRRALDCPQFEWLDGRLSGDTHRVRLDIALVPPERGLLP